MHAELVERFGDEVARLLPSSAFARQLDRWRESLGAGGSAREVLCDRVGTLVTLGLAT
jgi:hypothetical protein